MELNDFRPGDLIEITIRRKLGEETRSAVVTLVNYNNLGHVTFEGRHAEGMFPTGAGSFFPKKIGTTRYGYIRVKIVGHQPPSRNWRS